MTLSLMNSSVERIKHFSLRLGFGFLHHDSYKKSSFNLRDLQPPNPSSSTLKSCDFSQEQATSTSKTRTCKRHTKHALTICENHLPLLGYIWEDTSMKIREERNSNSCTRKTKHYPLHVFCDVKMIFFA